MTRAKLQGAEVIAMIGGAILAAGLFLPWYQLGNDNAELYDFGPGQAGLDLSAWDSLTILRILLLLAAIAPFILAYIVVRGHALSWPRGELTAVVGTAALTLVAVRGIILKPGEPQGQIGLELGYFVALAGAAVLTLGAITSTARSDTRARKPPGVL